MWQGKMNVHYQESAMNSPRAFSKRCCRPQRDSYFRNQVKGVAFPSLRGEGRACDESRCQAEALLKVALLEAGESPKPGTIFLISFHPALASKQKRASGHPSKDGRLPCLGPWSLPGGELGCTCVSVWS